MIVLYVTAVVRRVARLMLMSPAYKTTKANPSKGGDVKLPV